MTISSMGPALVDMPRRIAVLLKPLQGKEFKCDEAAAQNIWRFLEIYEHQGFKISDHDAAHDIMGRGEVYLRQKEAAELTLEAFKSAFGEFSLKSLKEAKEGALRAALCEAIDFELPVRVPPEEVEKGKKFFREWYAGAEKYLEKTVV